MSAAGFADPVMDVERLTLSYEDEATFREDARSLSMLPGLQAGPSAQVAASTGKRLELTIEVVFGHAWCPSVKRRADGLAVVQVHRNRGRL